MKPIKAMINITWDNGAEEETELEINDKLEIKHKGIVLSVKGEEKSEEDEQDE